MKLIIDDQAKTIRIEDNVLLSELFEFVYKLDINMNEYTILGTEIIPPSFIYHYPSPIFTDPLQPTTISHT